MLRQSTVALRVSKSYSKVAYLKFRNPELFTFFLSSSASRTRTLMREVTAMRKQ